MLKYHKKETINLKEFIYVKPLSPSFLTQNPDINIFYCDQIINTDFPALEPFVCFCPLAAVKRRQLYILYLLSGNLH